MPDHDTWFSYTYRQNVALLIKHRSILSHHSHPIIRYSLQKKITGNPRKVNLKVYHRHMRFITLKCLLSQCQGKSIHVKQVCLHALLANYKYFKL